MEKWQTKVLYKQALKKSGKYCLADRGIHNKSKQYVQKQGKDQAN